MTIFTAGAALGVVGMLLENSILVGAGIGTLALGVLIGVLGRRRSNDEDEDQE